MKRILLALAILLAAAITTGQSPYVSSKSARVVSKSGGSYNNLVVAPPGTPVLGDLIYFDGTQWSRLGKPADGTYSVKFTAGIPSYQSGGSGYNLVQNAGTPLTVRTTINCTGSLTCSDSGSVTTFNASSGGMSDPGGNGMVARTALNTTINRTIVCAAAYCSWANGDGVAGAPTLTLAISPGTPAGAIAGQSASPGTLQTTNNFFNISGIGQVEQDSVGTANGVGFALRNTTTTNGGATRQYGPYIEFESHAYTGAADDTWLWKIYPQVVNSGTTTSSLRFAVKKNAGAYGDVFQLFDNASALFSQSIVIPTSSFLNWQSRGSIQASADGAINIQTNSGAAYGDFTATSIAATEKTSGGGWKRQATQELLTLSLVSPTTVTAGNLAPANSKIVAIIFFVKAGITGAANFTVKVTGGNAFNVIGTASATNTAIAINNTSQAVPAAYADQFNLTATTLTITCNAQATAGQLRIVVISEVAVGPTS